MHNEIIYLRPLVGRRLTFVVVTFFIQQILAATTKEKLVQPGNAAQLEQQAVTEDAIVYVTSLPKKSTLFSRLVQI